MKKVVLSLAVLCSIALVSCGNKNAETTVDSDTVVAVVEDTTVAVEGDTAVVAVENDTVVAPAAEDAAAETK